MSEHDLHHARTLIWQFRTGLGRSSSNESVSARLRRLLALTKAAKVKRTRRKESR